MSSILRPTIVSLAIFTALFGFAYPVAVTGASQALFPAQANGSLLKEGKRTVGSRLIGQPFDDASYFWGRPSATQPFAYNGQSSLGSNLGPTNPALRDAVQARVDALRAAEPDNHAPIPIDLVTASASGLDPDISPAAAAYQVGRVAAARGMDRASVERLVAQHVQGRWLGLLGEPRVNVLELNLALDGAQ